MSAPDDSIVYWKEEFENFFKSIGLLETSKCLHTESLVLSRHNLERLPSELEKLVENLLKCLEQHADIREAALDNPQSVSNEDFERKSLTGRKRKRDEEEDTAQQEAEERVKRQDGEQVQIRATNKEMQQRINTFIQAKQNEVDASNRTEFLNRPDPTSSDVTCARTDAREINRNIQMKFDIVNNEDGPLARSLMSSSDHVQVGGGAVAAADEGASERIRNIEQHLNVTFDKNADPPFSLYERIKILENTLMEIERQHPKWAAVHFQQPNRTFPPPPPGIFISRATTPDYNYIASQVVPPSSDLQMQQRPVIRTTGRANSSLTRAVLEQLNRQRQLINNNSNT